MSQDVFFRIVLDDSAVPAASQRTQAGFRSIGQAADGASRQTAAAMRALPAQFTDVATQLAGGQNPLLVLLQQGGQIKDMFGGIRPAAAALASTLTVTNVAAIGLAGGFGLLSLGAYQGHAEVSALTKALALSGNAAGVTLGQIDTMARGLAEAGRGSIGDAREALSGLAASGLLMGQGLEVGSRAVLAVQRLSGRAAEDIVKDFAGMRNGVAEWSINANRAYNFLTPQVLAHVRALESQGRVSQAAQVTLDALAAAMESRAVPALGALDRAMEQVKRTGSGFWDWLKGIGRPETIEQQLTKVTEQLAAFDAGLAGLKVDSGRRKQIDEQRQQLRDTQAYLQERLRLEQRGAEAQAATAAQRQRELDESSSGMISARLGVEAAAQAKLLAQETAGIEARRRAAEDGYRSMTLTATQYRDQVVALERERIDAEERAARAEVSMASRRQAGTPQDVLARTAAITAAETKLLGVLAKRAQVEAEIEAGRLDPQLRPEPENMGWSAYSTWSEGGRAEVRYAEEQARKLAQEIAAYKATLDMVDNARALADSRDLAGRRLGDGARERQDRMAAIADQYNGERARLDAELRGNRITQTAYDERMGVLRSYYDNAIDKEQAYQEARARLEADGSVGLDRALANYLESSRNVAAQTERLWGNTFSAMEDGLIQFATTGKLNFSSFAQSVVADLMRIYVRQQLTGLFTSARWAFGASRTGAADANTMAGLWHGGGVLGVDQPMTMRAMPASTWARAPRFHQGLAGDEYPAILQRGESVLTPAQMRQLAPAGGGGVQLQLTVVNQTSQPVQATTRQRGDGGIELLLTAAKQAVAGDIATGQGDITSALQGRYGLRPTVG